MVLFACMGSLGIGYAFYNVSLQASPVNEVYYGVGDTFERTNKNSFEMGGINWQIFYTDASTHKGYIAGENLVSKHHCPNIVGGIYVQQPDIETCLAIGNQAYQTSGADDDFAEFIKTYQQFGNLRLMTLSEYELITKDETDAIALNHLDNYLYTDFWLNSFSDTGGQLLYWDKIKFSEMVYKQYQRIADGSKRYGTTSSTVIPIFEIDLPQKGIIQSISADQANITKPCTDAVNVAGSTIINIDTQQGKGPYHFYIYDVDAGGNGTYTNASQYFTLEADTQNGTAKVNLINTLPVGDYYFKVKVVDESTNERLYYSPNDFTKDPFRTKETNVIHVKIEKAPLTIAFDQPNDTKKTIEEAENNWIETTTATQSNGTKITYSIVGGDIGLIDLDEDTGEITYKGNGAFGKVKIRATVDDDPDTGNDNYNSAFTEKEIVIAREVDGVVTPDKASSDIHVPTFSMDQANIKANGIIGTIKGTLGTPDTIGGSTTTYKYEIKSGGQGSFFKVNSSTGVIQTNANLAVGTYNFTITVSDMWTSKDVSVTVNVGMAPAENLKFYENSSSNTIITKKSAKVTDTGVTVFATVKVTLRHSINSIINHSFYAK